MESNRYNEILAVVLARGGSERLPGKNLKKIGKYSLTELAVKTAMDLGIETLVSSDCKKILQIASKSGANTHLRSFEFSTAKTKSETSLINILHSQPNIAINKKELLLLQPTSPLRTSDQLYSFLSEWQMLKNSKKINQAISVTLDRSDFWFVYKGKPKRIREIFEGSNVVRTTLGRTPLYRENGLFYITKIKTLMETGSLVKSKLGLIITDKKTSIDIDDGEDLEIARAIYRYGK